MIHVLRFGETTAGIRFNTDFFFWGGGGGGELPCADGSNFKLLDSISVTIVTAILDDTDNGIPGRVGNQLLFHTKL